MPRSLHDAQLPAVFGMVVLFAGGCGGLGEHRGEEQSRMEKAMQPREKVGPVVPVGARPFPLDQVRLLDGPFKDATDRNRRYLHELESDRLLHTFRLNAGLPSDAEPLGGWEDPDCELRGHTMGHYLSACALMYASTGDEKLKAKADAIVAELAKCQDALGASGYLSAYPESFIDRVEAFERVWAPYYTLHKIFAGLTDMYRHCGNAQALEVVEKMAAWVKGRTDRLDEAHMQRMLDKTEQGGMNDALSNLYAFTGKPEHLALARRFDQKSYTEPLERREDNLNPQHANSFIPNIIGTAREYELAGDAGDRGVAEYFWRQVAKGRSFCTGGTSNYERWGTDAGELAGELSPESQESCCTYNMLKLTRHLFGWDPDAEYADYYERALYNGILATQDPDTGMTMYYVAMNPGHWKIFGTPRHSFWCCTGTGMENHAKYGDSIYWHDSTGVFVNLFIASEFTWPERGIRLRQETRFPEEERTTLVVGTGGPRVASGSSGKATRRGVEFAIRVRVPYWATRGVTVKVNGQKQETRAKPGSYLALQREWNDGDRIEIELPMSLHLHRMPDDPTLAAVMYGPLVLAGALGTEKLTREMQYVSNQRAQHHGPSIDVPYLVTETDDLGEWIRPVDGRALAFRTAGAGVPEDVTLVPFHRLFGERHTVYWRLYRKGSPEHRAMLDRKAARKALAARTVDSVRIGERDSEREHGLKSEKSSSGSHRGKNWRHSTDGGWFSYDIQVLKDRPMTLACTYWGSDTGGRVFDVLVDGQKIATQTLDRDRPGEFFQVEYKVPAELVKGKEKVTVRFQAHPGRIAGGVFGCAIMKDE